MTVVTALVVGYLLLSLFATIILVSACIVGGRFDKRYGLSSEFVEPSSIVEASVETLAEVRAEMYPEVKVANSELSRLMPQLIHQVTE